MVARPSRVTYGVNDIYAGYGQLRAGQLAAFGRLDARSFFDYYLI